MDRIIPYLPLILQGFGYTVMIAVLSILAALVIGLLLGLLRRSRYRLVRIPVAMFVEFARGTSEVVQMYWVFFALPILIMVEVPPVVAGILVLGINHGAYVSEIVRGAFGAIPKPQIEATTALNFSPAVRFKKVLFPQALAIMLPPLGNTAVDITKATSIVSLITVADLTFTVQQVRMVTGESVIPFGIALVLYLILTAIITFIFRRVENGLPEGLKVSMIGRVS